MAVYLNEEQAGTDFNVIGFPHLLLCLGVVLQTNAVLYGFHFGASATANGNATANAFLNFIGRMGGNVANGQRLYGCCNHGVRYGGGRGRHRAWRDEMRAIAGVLNYHGPVSGFDTAIINPRNGTYVEYRRVPHQARSQIFYKRHEKMDHPAVANVPAIPAATGTVNTFNLMTNNWRDIPVTTTGANLAPHATVLHELNYWLRLSTFDVP